MGLVQQAKDFIANAQTEKALELLNDNLTDDDLLTQVNVHLASFRTAKKNCRIGIITESDFAQVTARVNYGVLELLKGLSDDMPVETASSASPDKGKEKQTDAPKSVFISYNHSNGDVAEQLRKMLVDSGVEVIIDKEKMLAGEDIKLFIEDCVRRSDVTLSLVSRRSLMSAWVAMESVNTFFHEKTSTKRFIACYIDDSFFKRSFTDEVLDQIDAEVADIQATITKRLERNRGISDLQNELKRYRDLQNNIDEIIRRLRESLCIDISGDKLAVNFSKILESINS